MNFLNKIELYHSIIVSQKRKERNFSSVFLNKIKIRRNFSFYTN